MQPVHYQIKIGAKTYTPADQSALLDLHCRSALTVPVNHCRLILSRDPELRVKPDDPVTVALGYSSSTTPVFTGVVQAVEQGLDRTTLHALSAYHQLTTAHFNLLFEQSNAGNIVKDVAQSRLGLSVKTIENGLTFPVYVLGDRLAAADHVQHLAEQCGFDVYTTAEDKLVFAAYSAAQTHELTYGVNILSLTTATPLPAIAAVEVYGESPASQGQGDQAYAWLTKKEVKGTASGGSGATLRLSDPTARTQSLAGDIAQAKRDRYAVQSRGQVRVLGDGAIQLGDAIKLTKLPSSAQDGTFKVMGIAHRLTRQRGFCTTIDWQEV